MVEVTQEDREAAAELTGYEAIAYGMSDLSDAVQTLARHRIAARKQALEEAMKALKSAQFSPAPYTDGMAAIRKLAGEGQ